MTYLPKTYRKQGGDTFVVASGGNIDVETGGRITFNSTLQSAIAAVATTATTDAIVALNSALTVLRNVGLIST